MALKIDATRPLFAVVGAGDLAVKYARTYANDVQTRFAKVDLEPKVLRDQLEARVAELQADAKTLPAKVESFTNETVAELNETYGDLAARGRELVNRVRKQQATQDAKAAVKSTVTKAKTTRTQTAKSAKASSTALKNAAKTATSTAKKTGSTAKSSAKATGTSATRTASASTKAAGDAASKVGN
jgi:heparin binding hemagglutinin HbhA